MPVFDADQKTRAARPRRARAGAAQTPRAVEIRVRPVAAADLAAVIALDAAVTGLEKTDYWYEIFHRYGTRGRRQRFFLVAEGGGAIQGFIIGEVRDWEFGSPPCGWVFGINVRPETRLAGVGTRLLAAICEEFRRAGVDIVRTLLARDNQVVLSFFRSQGMMAAPVIALEMRL
jgi:ribosomal protein S18 acetylase RimI-like enzyme